MKDFFFTVKDDSAGLTRHLAPGVTARLFSSENVMLSFVSFEPGASGRIHSHSEEQWGLLLEGSGCRTQDGEEVDVGPGDFWRTPGGVEHGFRAGPDGARVLDVFVPPRKQYRQPGEGFG